jgi:hypothetical protein
VVKRETSATVRVKTGDPVMVIKPPMVQLKNGLRMVKVSLRNFVDHVQYQRQMVRRRLRKFAEHAQCPRLIWETGEEEVLEVEVEDLIRQESRLTEARNDLELVGAGTRAVRTSLGAVEEAECTLTGCSERVSIVAECIRIEWLSMNR